MIKGTNIHKYIFYLMDYVIFFKNQIDAICDVSALVSTAQYPKIYQDLLQHPTIIDEMACDGSICAVI